MAKNFQLLWLTVRSSNIDRQSLRAMWPEKILTSLHLSAENSRIRAPHNREVEDGGPTYRRPVQFKSFWTRHLIDFYALSIEYTRRLL